MRYAIVDGERVEPRPGIRGNCQMCGRTMIAKCGKFVKWHWAHKPLLSCDPWHESETDWHLAWKDGFPRECQEIVQYDGKSGVKHIADVRTHRGFVVEIQHSPISKAEVESREKFYGEMIWIVDARHLDGWFTVGTSHDLVCYRPIAYGIRWQGRSKLLDIWSRASAPVFFDVNDKRRSRYDAEDDKLWFLSPPIDIPVHDRTLWRLLSFDADKKEGLIAPVFATHVIGAVNNGEVPPLHACREEEAWRFRRTMHEVGGRINEKGIKRPLYSSLRAASRIVKMEQGEDPKFVVRDGELGF